MRPHVMPQIMSLEPSMYMGTMDLLFVYISLYLQNFTLSSMNALYRTKIEALTEVHVYRSSTIANGTTSTCTRYYWFAAVPLMQSPHILHTEHQMPQ
jgi:hypothetical protein